MVWTGWNNGRLEPGGYGLRVPSPDRDAIFSRAWKTVIVQIPEADIKVQVELSPTFWRRCAELRSAAIGRWLSSRRYAPWPRRQPPKFRVEHDGTAIFRVVGPT